VLYKNDLEANVNVCPKCGHHHRIGARARLDAFLDAEGRFELGQEVLPVDALKFKDNKRYPDRLKAGMEATGETDALIVMGGSVCSIPLVAACFEFDFMGGSMGSVVGEKIARMFERGAERRQPVILLSASGGARMQEGVLSLMQMGKTVAALGMLREARAPFISVCLNPTTGGVAASFALLGDVNIAEPRALIGFAGPRVIENTIRQKLPEGFQTSEYLLEHGMLDLISERKEMRANIARILSHLMD
jgi:acetyl-CoA carboxylase carboxyl transferase subunit beta